MGVCEGPAARGRQAELQEEEEEAEFLFKVAQDAYTCCMEYSCSDHKPVIGTFSLQV